MSCCNAGTCAAATAFSAASSGSVSFLEGVVTPDRWCDRARWLAEQIDPLGSELGDKQQQIIKDRLGTILAQLRVAQRIYEDEVPEGDWGAQDPGGPDRADRRLLGAIEGEELAGLRRRDSPLLQAAAQLAQRACRKR